MPHSLSRDQARSLDRYAMDIVGIPGVVLMENAGRGCTDLLVSLGVQGRVVICCGKGNNGGDGFVIARHLDNRSVDTRVLLFADPATLTGDAATNYRILALSGPPIVVMGDRLIDEAALAEELSKANWVVDALFGTGLTGPVRPPMDRVIETINACPAKILAIDIPSGLDADTGKPQGATIRAHHTATIAALKKGFLEPDAQPFLGQVHVIDMGLPSGILRDGAFLS